MQIINNSFAKQAGDQKRNVKVVPSPGKEVTLKFPL
jgi:hypothetical protein